MDIESLRVFVKIAEVSSFSRAAEQLGMPKSRVSQHIATLEAELGTHLLQRTTRVVRLTADGEQFVPRARRLVVDADELETMFQAPSTLRGQVRVDAPINFARNVLIPRLPDFFALHPQIDVLLSTTDRRVEVVREGFDCVLSIGTLVDSGLVAKRIGLLPMINCASPAYLRKYGTPRTPSDLDRHLVVDYALTFGASPPSFEYGEGGRFIERPMRARITVNSTDAYLAACLAGLGIIQAPRIGMLDKLREGALVEILPTFTCAPMPVSIVHPHARTIPKRVRAVISWLAQTMEPHLDAG